MDGIDPGTYVSIDEWPGATLTSEELTITVLICQIKYGAITGVFTIGNGEIIKKEDERMNEELAIDHLKEKFKENPEALSKEGWRRVIRGVVENNLDACEIIEELGINE